MKLITKRLAILGAILSFGLLFPTISLADGSGEVIVVKEQSCGDGNDTGPRGIIVPIQAAYEANTHLVSIAFLSNLGIVNIDIENEDTGELSTYMVNSAVVNHSFIISGDSGYWSITFTLLNGTEYVGLWTL